jgi:hypothetical protein
LRDAWLIVGISVAALCLLEAGLSLAFFAVDRLTWRPFELRLTADAESPAAPQAGPPLSAAAAEELARQTYRTDMEPMEPFFRRTYLLIRGGDLDETHGVRDISSIFSDVRIPIFVDEFHLGETGSEMVARISDLLKRVAERQVLRKTTSPPRLAD